MDNWEGESAAAAPSGGMSVVAVDCRRQTVESRRARAGLPGRDGAKSGVIRETGRLSTEIGHLSTEPVH